MVSELARTGTASVSQQSSSQVRNCHLFILHCQCKSVGKSRRTQLFAGVSHEPYQPARNHIETNE